MSQKPISKPTQTTKQLDEEELDEVELDEKKLEICQCYYRNKREGKPPPTFEEIKILVGFFNTRNVYYHINDSANSLVNRGIMSRMHGERKYRNYELTEKGIRYVERALGIEQGEEPSGSPISALGPGEAAISGIPLLGTTAAGKELEFIFGEPGERITIERELGGDNYFAVHVSGTSMIGDHIYDGDCVFLRPQSACSNGDIVLVARIETPSERGLEGFGYATLKHFVPKDDGIHLQSSNNEVDDILIPKRVWDKEWQIQGKVIAVFHRLHPS